MVFTIPMFMHSRIDFTLLATVSHWSETAPYSDDPDPFQSAVFSRVEFLITHLLISYLVPTCIILHLAVVKGFLLKCEGDPACPI